MSHPFDDPRMEEAFQKWITPIVHYCVEDIEQLRESVIAYQLCHHDLLLDCGDRAILRRMLEEPIPQKMVKGGKKVKGTFKDPEREAAFQNWLKALGAPASAVPKLRNKIRKLKMTAEELDADTIRLREESQQNQPEFKCRQGCGACCVFMSISSPIPGHPNGKPAGVTCNALTKTWECSLYNTDLFPAICKQFKGDPETCGKTFEEAKKGIIALERQTTTQKKETAMGKGVVKSFILKKWQDVVDNYKAEIEDLIIKSGVKAVIVKPHYFYDSSTKTMAWTDSESVIRSSKSGITCGFYRHDKYVPEEHRSEHTFIVFCGDRGAVYGTAFLVTTLYEHWEIPVIEELRDEMALRRVLELGLSTDQPFPELEQVKTEQATKWKEEDGYKAELTLEEQNFLRDLVKGKLNANQHEALFEQAEIPFGFIYNDLSAVGKAKLWNILMDAEELGGDAIDIDIRVALQNYGKETQQEAATS
jgi:uncharacterized protein